LSLANLAVVLSEKGELREAETNQRAALAMQRRFFGNDHPTVANLLNNLGATLAKQGRLVEAETNLCEALGEVASI
jgi:Tfp pilus assembly protein PilF